MAPESELMEVSFVEAPNDGKLPAAGVAVWRAFCRLPEPAFLVRLAPVFIEAANPSGQRELALVNKGALTATFKHWLTRGSWDSVAALLAQEGGAAQDIPVWTQCPNGSRAQSMSIVPVAGCGFVILFVRSLNKPGLRPVARASLTEVITQVMGVLQYPAWVASAENKWVSHNEAVTKLLPWLPPEYGSPTAKPSDASSKEWLTAAGQVRVAGAVEKIIDLGAGGSWRLVRCLLDEGGSEALGCVAFPMTAPGDQAVEPKATTAPAGSAGSAGLLAARERERAALAREIHDSLGQELTVLRLATERLQRELSQERQLTAVQEARFASVTSQVESVINITRRIAVELRQDLVTSHGLAHAANSLVLDFGRRLMIPGQLEVSEGWQEPELSMAQNLYRMLQELLNNLAKHAQASRFMVRLSFTGEAYVLEVTDDGCGMAATAAQARPNSIGLRSLNERADLYSGVVTVLTRPSVPGTQIIIRLPERRLSTERRLPLKS